jgi:hypothetical protein
VKSFSLFQEKKISTPRPYGNATPSSNERSQSTAPLTATAGMDCANKSDNAAFRVLTKLNKIFFNQSFSFQTKAEIDDQERGKESTDPIKVNTAINYVNFAQITDAFRAVVPVMKQFKSGTVDIIDITLNSFLLGFSGLYIVFIICLILRNLDNENNRVKVKIFCVLIGILATLVNGLFILKNNL